VTTDDDEIAERVRLLRNYGSRVKYYHEVKGFNSRLDPLQAAFLRVKLKHLDEWNRRRQEIATRYLANAESKLELWLPFVPDYVEPVWHLFVIRHLKRDQLLEHLLSSGIETLIHYPVPPHLSIAYADQCRDCTHLSITEQTSRTCLSLPIGPQLTDEQQIKILETMRRFKP